MTRRTLSFDLSWSISCDHTKPECALFLSLSLSLSFVPSLSILPGFKDLLHFFYYYYCYYSSPFVGDQHATHTHTHTHTHKNTTTTTHTTKKTHSQNHTHTHTKTTTA